MSLLKSTAIVSSLTMISRVLGFARDVVFAIIFGAAAGTDAFFVAFKIPNFMRRLFAEGAFSQAFVPVLSEYKTRRTLTEVQELVGYTAGTLGGVLAFITVVGVLGAPALVALFAPGFIGGSEAKFALTSELLRVTFPYLMLISLTALAGGVLNSYGRFAVPAVTPVWLNICLIAAALWLTPLFETQVMALAWGVFAAGFVQLLFQLPSLARLGLLTRPRWDRRDEGVQRIMRLMLPALFGSSVAQINLLLDTVIASFLVTGSVSWLYYSDRLVELPLGVFGVALGTVMLPSLSRRFAEENADSFSRTLDWGLRWVLLIGTPAALGLMLLAAPLIATLFQYGAFGQEDVRMAALSLTAYGFGLLGFMLVKVLAPGFYSRQDTKTPVKIGVTAMVANMMLNLLFVVPMALVGIPGPHAGLALATSMAAFLNAFLLFRRLRREAVYAFTPGWRAFLWRIALANGLMGVFLTWAAGPLEGWLAAGAAERALHLAGAVGGGALVYMGALWLVGMRPGQLVHRP